MHKFTTHFHFTIYLILVNRDADVSTVTSQSNSPPVASCAAVSWRYQNQP